MKIMSVVGARPNFMKVAPIISAIQMHNDAVRAGGAPPPGFIEHVLVHTGQHYDHLMSDSFFKDLGLPNPNVHLGVGSGSHAAQTAEVMKKFEVVFLRERPDYLIVVGDVNSTVACALVAAKLSCDGSSGHSRIAHVEAGLRSFDRGMPEEINRVVTDQLSDLLFVTEKSGLRNLEREGISRSRISFVGNTMIDTLLAYKEKANSSSILADLQLQTGGPSDGVNPRVTRYCLLTLHRPANVDCRDALVSILDGLDELRTDCTVVFPAHPRTCKRISEFGLDSYFASDCNETTKNRPAAPIRLTEPLGYLDFLCLMKNATLVVTDSGGIQEETTCLGVPCVTARENTERPATVETGTNVLGGVQSRGIREAIHHQLHSPRRTAVPEKWDGHSAVRILDVIVRDSLTTNPAAAAREHSADKANLRAAAAAR